MSIDLRARLERARPGGTNPATPMRGRAGVRGRAGQMLQPLCVAARECAAGRDKLRLNLLLINIRKVGTKKCGAFFGENTRGVY